MIVGHLGDQEEQDPQGDLLLISFRNRDKEESHQLENQVAGGQADLTSVPKEKRKGEGGEGKKNFSQWTLRPIPLMMLRYPRVK